MGRRPSPRPSYDKPTAIPYDEATLHLWGDEESGYVEDRIFVSSDRIHQLELSIPPGGRFQHSDQNRTVFAADQVYYVLEGTMVLANPATGEVQRVRTGEAAFFRRDTWHHAYNYDASRRLRALELFAPPPSQGTSSAYARTKENITEWSYGDDTALTRWPMDRAQIEEKHQIHVLGEEDVLWRIEDPDGDLLVGLYASTDHLTVGRGTLLPGRRGPRRRHGGDQSVYVLDGTLNVFLPEADSIPSWFALRPGDAFYLPIGTTYEFHNISAESATFLFAVAPSYLEREDDS